MKKFTLTVLAAVLTLAATIPVANAAVGTGTFNVIATLTSACTVGTFTGPLDFGTVVSFAIVAPPTAITSSISCTRGLTGVTASFDTTGAVTTGGATSATPVGAGLLSNGLYYTISGAFAGAAAGAAATSSSAGTADTRVFTVSGAMGAQAGTCTTASCIATPQVRTLTLNY